MRAFSYAWSLPVTLQSWYSLICRSGKAHATRRLHGSMFIEWQLWPLEVLHCRDKDFRPFLLLWPWPWSDHFHIGPTNLTRIPWRYTRCVKMNLRQVFRKLSYYTACECVHLVTGGHFRARDIKMAVTPDDPS